MSLRKLTIEKQRTLLSRLTCGEKCFSCGSFEDYTGRCKLNYVYRWEEWQDFVKRNPKGNFAMVLEEIQFKECLRNLRASGVRILYDESFNFCDDCGFKELCLSPEKGRKVTKVKKEL